MISLPQIQQELEIPESRFNFTKLPDYADFLLRNHLNSFSQFIIDYARKLDTPMLRHFTSLSEEQLLQIGIEGNRQMLAYVAGNKTAQFVNIAVSNWLLNPSSLIPGEQAEIKDFTDNAFIRRRAFRNFMQLYSDNPQLHKEIMDEVDEFTTEIESLSIKVLMDMRQGVNKEVQSITGIGNWVWNLKTNKITWSEELYKIYELEPSLSISYGGDLQSYNHPEDAELVQEEIKRSIETLQPHDFYYRIILKNGKEKILHARGQVQSDSNGKPLRLLGTLQDVTKQKRSEQELREKQNFLEKIANVTPSLIAAYNIHTGKYIFVNHALKTLLGYEPSELLEKGAEFVLPLVHPDDLGPLNEKNNKALEVANEMKNVDQSGESVVEFRYRLLHKNGEYRWFQTIGTVFNRNAENKVEHILNISVDITDQVKAAQELQEINDELQKQEKSRRVAEEKLKEYARNLRNANNSLTRSNHELQQFAYAASHDLQEPLRKIIIFSGKLQQEYKDLLPDMGREYINKMVSSSQRMSRLIDDLLNFSRVSRSEDKFEDVNLNEILQNVLNDCEVVIAQKNAIITYDSLPVVPGIPLQMTQLFQNIISNALKFSREGVSPMITVSLQQPRPDELSIYPHLNQALPYHRIVFKDNGIGFNQAYAEQIFTIFQRLHGRSEYSGTGIGLALCRKIADNHNGIILAKSEENKGAEFHILLPAQQTFSNVVQPATHQ